jgi:hypothetical protein
LAFPAAASGGPQHSWRRPAAFPAAARGGLRVRWLGLAGFVANIGNKLGVVLLCSSRLLRGYLLCHLVPAVTCSNVSWDAVDSLSSSMVEFCIANRCTLCEQIW